MTQAMPSHPSRHLPLDGTYNVRDLGGYETRDGAMTRWRTFFRADGLHRIHPEAQATLLRLGARQVIDLRRTEELQAAPNVFAASDRVIYRHLSLLEDTPPVVQGDPTTGGHVSAYFGRAPGSSRILAHFAERAPGGVSLHGWRIAPVIAALLLGLVGVPDETIVADYALSSTYLSESYLADLKARVETWGYTWEQYQPLSISRPEFMASTLSHLNQKYGGSAAYLRDIGLGEVQLNQLRQAFLEEA